MAATEVLPSVEVPAAVKSEQDEIPALTPPVSIDTDKRDDDTTDPAAPGHEEDVAEIVPDHYYNDGQIPVFKPTMKEFESFPKFVRKIDKYGMQSGIVKVIPPPEWRQALPALDEQVKGIKVKNPIVQEFHGSHGIYTQANMEKQRSYNLPQWKSVTSESNHQPPAKRGERRRNQEKAPRVSAAPRAGRTATPAKAATPAESPEKRGRGRPRKHTRCASTVEEAPVAEGIPGPSVEAADAPLTPASPSGTPQDGKKAAKKQDKSKSGGSKSVSSRRTHNSAAQVEEIDETAFHDFDYRLDNPQEWSKARCEELEPLYWKSLNFNNPMYGADMPGSLFDDTTSNWNVAKLENLLDVLGQKVPGVNTAYLYLGMWKATFAWHLEDVDLYSINYIHFGAPKQWYSISQKDARKFEKAMKSIWPQDAKSCDQFLRHKTYLVSPQILKSQYGVEVNKLVHYEGEFVITFPYGYHSGYNLGYNCAESVNFATEAWLDYGKIARKCNCEADSVWVDVFDIERKLRGEPTPEYWDEEKFEDDGDLDIGDLPTPPSSEKDQVKPGRKRKVPPGASKEKSKRMRLTMGPPKASVCVLCPHDPPFEALLPTEEGKMAHRLCALYIPETYVTGPEGNEVVAGVKNVDKKRREIRCLACRNKNGAVFQCSQKKCARAYHPTCGSIAGVSVEIGLTSFYGEDGTEYQDIGMDFRCRFHRAKRPKQPDEAILVDTLENHTELYKYANVLQRGDLIQYQMFGSEIRSGYVLENNESEDSVLIQTMPTRTTREVPYKYLLFLEKSHQQLKPPSANAIPLPAHLAHRQATSQEDPTIDAPQQEEPFHDVLSIYKWGEFRSTEITQNPDQRPVVLDKPNIIWHYLGEPSTDSKAHYTHDLSIRIHNTASVFLKTVGPRPTATARATNATSSIPKPKKAATAVNKPPIGQSQPFPSSSLQPRMAKIAPAPIQSPMAPVWPRGAVVDAQALRNQQAFMASSTAHSRQMSLPHTASSDLALANHPTTHAHHPADASPVTPESTFTYTSSGASVNTPPSVLSLQKEASASHKIWGRYADCAHFQDWLENRPLVYKSPYGPPGIIHEDHLPFPPPSRKPRSAGLAQSYFLSRSTTEQQVLKPHVRTVSTEKAQLRVQEAERRRLLSDSRPGSAHDSYFGLDPGAFGGTEQPAAELFGHLHPVAHQEFSESSGAPSYSTYTPQHFQPPHGTQTYRSSGGGEAGGKSLGIQTRLPAATTPPGHGFGYADDLGDVSNGASGSPLRKGRDRVGGETLPVMQDYNY